MDFSPRPLFSRKTDALEAIHIKLVKTPEDLRNNDIVFKPDFVHQIFDNGIIDGFAEAKVDLYYAAATMNIYASVNFAYKDSDLNPNIIIQRLTEEFKLEKPFYDNLDLFEQNELISEKNNCTPVGEKLDAFTITDQDTQDERHYEVYFGDVDVPGLKDYISRVQTLSLFFIDGSNLLDLDDPKWLFIICFEKEKTSSSKKPRYFFVGYSAIYQFPDFLNVKESQVKMRISHFLVSPPYQRKGIAGQLLTSIYKLFDQREDISYMTVEDPNMYFQYVRDYVDCKRILNSPQYKPEILRDQGISQDLINILRKELKLYVGQVRRILEILRLYEIKKINSEELHKSYRLEIKKRLNKYFEKQMPNLRRKRRRTSQLEDPKLDLNMIISDDERKTKLSELFEDLLDEYGPIITKLEKELR